jgi:hypothetical protein
MSDQEKKAQWKTPVVSRLGNVRDWVREGGAKGKSGADEDGGTSGSNEAMDP